MKMKSFGYINSANSRAPSVESGDVGQRFSECVRTI